MARSEERREGWGRGGEEENSSVATITQVHVLLQKSASKVVLGGGLSREKEG